jgi:hypothetical protein
MPFAGDGAKKAHDPHDPQRCVGLRWGSLEFKAEEAEKWNMQPIMRGTLSPDDDLQHLIRIGAGCYDRGGFE